MHRIFVCFIFCYTIGPWLISVRYWLEWQWNNPEERLLNLSWPSHTENKQAKHIGNFLRNPWDNVALRIHRYVLFFAILFMYYLFGRRMNSVSFNSIVRLMPSIKRRGLYSPLSGLISGRHFPWSSRNTNVVFIVWYWFDFTFSYNGFRSLKHNRQNSQILKCICPRILHVGTAMCLLWNTGQVHCGILWDQSFTRCLPKCMHTFCAKVRQDTRAVQDSESKA